MNKLNLSPEQQEIVMASLRAKFDHPNTNADDCLNICLAAVNMGLPLEFVKQLRDDMYCTYPHMKEIADAQDN